MILPTDENAESAVIGACLLGAEPPALSPEDFWVSDHREAWKAIVDLYSHGKHADVVTVADASGVDVLELLDTQASTPGKHAVKHYAEIVADHALRRRLIKACSEITTAAEEGSDDLRGQAERLIFAAAATEEDAEVSTLASVLGEVIDNLEKAQQGVTASAISTGLKKLDDLAGGLPRGSLVVIGARPAQGKSALCGNLTTNIAKTGLKVLFVSVEMSRWELGMRMLSGEAGTSWRHFRDRGPEMMEWGKLTDAWAKLEPLPVVIMDAGNATVGDIRTQARKMKADLVIVDYLQLLASHHRGENRNLELADLSRSLKLLAKELNVPVVVCSQLNRDGERDNREPVLRDLRDSGAIEADADQVWFLHCDKAEQDHDPRQIKLIVRKNRNGPTGSLLLTFHASTTTFRGEA